MFMNYDNHPYQKSQNEQNEESRRLLTESETSSIRISAYYDDSITDGTLDSDDIDFIKQVMSATIRYYQSFIKIIPVVILPF